MEETKTKGKSKSFIILFSAIALVLIAYTIYWFVASNAIHKGVLNWMQEQRAAGYSIEHSGTKVTGFPYRFTLEIDSPILSTPDKDWTWQGEKLLIVMQTYNYNHFIGFAPGRHILTDAENVIYTTDSSGFQASFSRKGEKLNQISIIANSLVTNTSANDKYTITGPNLHISPMPESPDDLRIYAGFDTLTLSDPVSDAEYLGTEIGPLKARIAITQGVKALEQGGDIVQLVDELDPSLMSPLTEFKWGALELKAKTDSIKIDNAHRPTGLVNLRVENIADLKAAMQAENALDKNQIQALTIAENMMKKEDAFLPISLHQGKVKIMFQDIAEIDPLY